MKHLKIFFLLAISFSVSCTKNNEWTSSNFENRPLDFKKSKVTICHLTGNGDYKTISVSAKAVKAHLAHGDYLSDETGSCPDCTQCDVNAINQYEWVAYLDTDDLTCTIYTGVSIWIDLSIPDGSARGVSVIELAGTKYILSWYPGGEYCQRVVGQDITEEEWQACRSYLRGVITTRPETPELCDLLNEQPGLKSLAMPFDIKEDIPFSKQSK